MIVDLLSWDFRFIMQDYIAWAIGIAALIWGGGPERAVAIVWLLLFEIAHGAYGFIYDGEHFGGTVDVFYAFVDAIAAAAWIAIALFANRNYTLWIAAMQVLAVSAHMASGIAEPISSIGYGVMVVAPSWIQLLLMATGLTRHVMRTRKFGPYRDWRVTSFTTTLGVDANGTGPIMASISNGKLWWKDSVK